MSKQLYRIENALFNQVWCLREDKYLSMIKQLQAHYNGEIRTDMMDGFSGGGNVINLNIPDNVAFINVDGTLGKHLNLLETSCGGVDYDSICQQLITANDDTNIDSVLLYINSNGGSVVGLPETAQLISEVADNKDVICYVDVGAYSAAYWLASQCTSIYCAPSAYLGNIGCWNVYLSQAGALQKAGIEVTFISGSTSPLKTAGNSLQPLSEDAKAMFQSHVDNIENAFKGDVLSKRDVAPEAMTGGWYMGNQAVDMNLADGTLNNIQELVASLSNN